ncbi:AAA family ATPase [Eubacterium oxidoreducens]|uniref:Uncharacterized protein n=1 Tax=Eubacterium oxidoreducens TaxID=1732 RepID=A0A1G6CGY0_EUBOX|nr:AAA family ATPase [Eubacterium oxidoreducens]SDB32164.1 hypothetical protein SAMN02910417_02399 [Eubacterium oxidoreducens]
MKSVFLNRTALSIEKLDPPYNTLEKRTTDKECISIYNEAQLMAGLDPIVVKAVQAYFSKDESTICLVKISDTSYAVETILSEGILLATISANGRIRGSLRTDDGSYKAIPNLENDTSFDTTAFIVGFLPILREKFPEVNEILENLETSSNHLEPFAAKDLYKLSDSLEHIFTDRRFDTDEKGGNIALLEENTIEHGGLCYNKVLAGCPTILAESHAVNEDDNLTVAEARKEFAAFSSEFHWEEDELAFIPVFEDDFVVPNETLKIARRYVLSAGEKRPMVNFMWRGVTAYGKSTGVEVLACILNMPLLRVTCNSNMETQDFLSDFVPNTDTAGDAPRFKHIESNFVKALTKGYIVEVQEISRIKDSGVLVGLNEYDKAGSIIPLVDGSYLRRHPKAMVVYTDNVGYNSCRPIDPSVIRRMSFIIDSYDLPKEKALARLELNTNVHNHGILEKCYNVWLKIRDYCYTKGITDGSISLSELEMWVLSVKLDGYRNFRQNCIECVIAKATNDLEEQDEIITGVVDLYL